ncbi:MAG: hypothetical protein Q9174_005808, partial [Haloplaca sp. 1 TL-2023]
MEKHLSRHKTYCTESYIEFLFDTTKAKAKGHPLSNENANSRAHWISLPDAYRNIAQIFLVTKDKLLDNADSITQKAIIHSYTEYDMKRHLTGVSIQEYPNLSRTSNPIVKANYLLTFKPVGSQKMVCEEYMNLRFASFMYDKLLQEPSVFTPQIEEFIHENPTLNIPDRLSIFELCMYLREVLDQIHGSQRDIALRSLKQMCQSIRLTVFRSSKKGRDLSINVQPTYVPGNVPMPNLGSLFDTTRRSCSPSRPLNVPMPNLGSLFDTTRRSCSPSRPLLRPRPCLPTSSANTGGQLRGLSYYHYNPSQRPRLLGLGRSLLRSVGDQLPTPLRSGAPEPLSIYYVDVPATSTPRTHKRVATAPSPMVEDCNETSLPVSALSSDCRTLHKEILSLRTRVEELLAQNDDLIAEKESLQRPAEDVLQKAVLSKEWRRELGNRVYRLESEQDGRKDSRQRRIDSLKAEIEELEFGITVSRGEKADLETELSEAKGRRAKRFAKQCVIERKHIDVVQKLKKRCDES